MAHAAHPPIAASQPALACRLGRYIFRIVPQAGQLTYSVSDGRRTISEPILEVFGSGSIERATSLHGTLKEIASGRLRTKTNSGLGRASQELFSSLLA